MNVPLRLANGRAVAFVRDGLLIVPIESRNYLAIARGYSVDAGVLAQAIRHGVSSVEFLNLHNGRRWRVSMATFRENAKRFDFGYGPKLACSEEFYREIVPATRHPQRPATNAQDH